MESLAAAPCEQGASSRPAPTRLEAVYRQHYAFVWRNARRLGAPDDVVDDATHEVFLVAAKRLHEFEGRADLRTWLFAITMHVVRAMRRKNWTYTRRLERYAELKRSEPRADHEQQAHAARTLRQMLAKLEEKRCTVFVLSELEGMTTQEIARELAVPPGTVDSRLRAARIQLRSMLERDARRARSSER